MKFKVVKSWLGSSGTLTAPGQIAESMTAASGGSIKLGQTKTLMLLLRR